MSKKNIRFSNLERSQAAHHRLAAKYSKIGKDHDRCKAKYHDKVADLQKLRKSILPLKERRKVFDSPNVFSSRSYTLNPDGSIKGNYRSDGFFDPKK